MTQIFKISEVTPEVLKKTAAALKNGAVIVIPTETVYGLAASAENEIAVEKICKLKKNPSDKPLQLLLPSLKAAEKYASFNANAQKIASKFWPGPLTLLVPATESGKPFLKGKELLGIRVPDNEFMAKLLNAFGAPLSATSANEHSAPPLSKEQDILNAYKEKVDYIFINGDIDGEPSTVAQADPLRIIREGAVKINDLASAL